MLSCEDHLDDIAIFRPTEGAFFRRLFKLSSDRIPIYFGWRWQTDGHLITVSASHSLPSPLPTSTSFDAKK